MPLRGVVAPLNIPLIGLEQHLARDGADVADLRIINTELRGVVQYGMDMETGGRWLAAQLAEAVDELLLEVIGEVVLGAEEDNAAL